ncbi:cell wall-binding repeat-containing protein [Desulfitobacterium sp. THU1]|uniref:cell wall-binding repeat-containing protein n=1 Tax=Desulfitobacterium sp. THU1 TaxID=3138072 RepID=UPI00311DF69E
MKKTKKALASLAIAGMVLSMAPASIFAANADTDRLAGTDRIGTALAIADEGWDSANTVILAPADQANLVDSLAAAPLAGQENAPVLLTFKGKLDAGVKTRIADLKAGKVYVIGAISDAVAAEVDAIDGVSVEKLAGADRWATADKINTKLSKPAGTFVVGYNAIPDALSVASYAAAEDYAIVLANADGTVPASKLVGDKTYLVGGSGVVKDYSGATRLGGADRYATNKSVVEGLSYNFDKVYVANGLSMVDALAASSLAAQNDAAILLTNGTSVPAGAGIKDKLGMVVALGGTGVVSDSVINSLTGELGNVVKAAVEEKNYDNDTKNQYVAFTVNGKKVTVEAINAQGWDLEFTAGTTKSSPTGSAIFADATTGLLEDSIALDDYYVQLTLTKGSDVVISDVAKITVKNLNLAATGISDYTLTNASLGSATAQMKSTKLVVGETATFEEITVTAGTAKEDITYTGSEFSIKTSDAGVISKLNNTITAQTPGTATITIAYGNTTKAVTFTVVNDSREAKSIQVKQASDGAVVTSLKTSTDVDLVATVLDQYGDPDKGSVLTADVSNEVVLDAATETLASGAFTVTLATPKASGNSTVTFFADGIKIGTFVVTVSTDTAINKKTFEMYKVDTTQKLATMNAALAATLEKSNFSTDTTIDIADDQYLVYQVANFNAGNIFLGNDTLSFTFATDVIESKSGVLDSTDTAIVTDADGNDRLVIKAGTETGTATVKVKDNSGKLYTVKVTVINQGYTIKSVSLKTPATSNYGKTYDYKSVLNYTAAGTGSHPIVTGITLNKAAAQELRFDTTNAEFYIDKDSDGTNNDSAVVGTLVITGVGTIGGVSNPGDASSFTTQTGDNGTIVFKILDNDGKIVASKSVGVDI